MGNMSSKGTIAVVLGLGTVGAAEDPMAKYNTPAETQEFISTFREASFRHLDTSRGYSPHAPGTSEPLIGQTDFAQW